MHRKWWYKMPFFIIVACIAALAIGFIVMTLWNALIPVLFAGPVISFWQAVGLLILSKILLGGWAHGHHGRHGHHRHWRQRFAEKMASMPAEEREKFREHWQHYCKDSFYKDFSDMESMPPEERREFWAQWRQHQQTSSHGTPPQESQAG